jgi:uncharacterized membrane protein HdeD (DUF308 family)
MATFFGIVLFVIGASAMIQSFRTHNTREELNKAGMSQGMLKSSLRNVRILGIACLAAAGYLLFMR